MNSRTINSGTPASFAYQGNEMSSASGSENFTLDYDLNGNMISGMNRADANRTHRFSSSRNRYVHRPDYRSLNI
ncbi:MAG: hypothetical protein NTW93_10085 [Phycisphaerae bacterium]|nr:hypothetical protein [Phycisphaerae bacterium]